MCGCDCCQNSNPTCFDPQAMEASGTYYGWACKCSCPGCMANVIQGAMAYADVKMMRDKGSPSDGTTTANHAPGCPAIADVRDGCSCLLRQTSSTGPASSYPPTRVPPTSRGPGEEREYGTPTEPPDESVAVFCDTDGDLIPMKRFDGYWYGRGSDDRGTWVQCVAQLGKPIAVHVPGASRIAVAAQGDYPHDDPCDRWEMVTYVAPSGFISRVVMEKSDHGMFVSVFDHLAAVAALKATP